METSSENNAKVIKKNDPDFPGYLDFDFLRSTGIRHLGELSGKIWTDHNVHDPGITILEMLCYALIDLGYRTQLPIGDLLATRQKNDPEDNFFTPGELLTSNPVTIMDYRKLIIDTPGVRNAWLEIHEDTKFYLNSTYLNDNLRIWDLSCYPGQEYSRSPEIMLNGLYNIYLELERPDMECPVRHDSSKVKEIIGNVREKLHGHRNLGEDFVKISILCEEEIRFCGRIGIRPEADAEKVDIGILKALHDFLSPPLRFYTLSELLDRGIPIETIFSGRPWLNESFGFLLDSDLEQAHRVKEIHLSDIYALIGNVDGVVSVTDLRLISNKSASDPRDCNYWIHRLARNHVPVLCARESCFDLYKNGSNRQKTDTRRVISLFKQKIAAEKKALFRQPFDKPVAYGNYPGELADYFSIQHEFPRTYGIGEGGLPADATNLRKAQALQLKGYLLFYEQLLANYLSQLAHLRDMFSFRADSVREESAKHTYFGGSIETVPMIDKLMRFYTDNFEVSAGWVENTVLALPVSPDTAGKGTFEEAALIPVSYSSDTTRESNIGRLKREFMQNEYEIEILPDECGYVFSIRLADSPVSLQSKRTFKNQSEARQAAKTVAFLASLDEAYQRINQYDVPEFSFEIVYKPVNYLNYLQTLLEDKYSYLERRGQFLDHLLDRFAEQFTDYALLAYSGNGTVKDLISLKEKENECKAKFLTNFPFINRNRGQAFNYQINGWNNGNISGFERRVAALSCLDDWKRKTLCNFEIFRYDDEFVFEIRDEAGHAVFRSSEKYTSREDAISSYETFLKDISDSRNLITYDRPEDNRFGIRMRYSGGSVFYREEFDNAFSRDLEQKKIFQFMYPISVRENIFTSEKITRLILADYGGEHLKQSRKQYPGQAQAYEDAADFVEKINNQLWLAGESDRSRYELMPASEERTYIDTTQPMAEACQVAAQFRWTLSDLDGTVLMKSTEVFRTAEDALKGISRIMEFDPSDLRVENVEQDKRPALVLIDKGGDPIGRNIFDQSTGRDKCRKRLEGFLGKSFVGENWLRKIDQAYSWELWMNRDQILKSSVLFDDRRKADAAADRCRQLCLSDENFHVANEDDGFRLFVMDKNDPQAFSLRAFGSEKEALRLIPSIRTAWENNGLKIPENENGFQYTVPRDGKDHEPVLVSYHIFRTREDALNGLHDLLKTARRKNAYYPVGDAPNLNFNFFIRATGGRFLAKHPATFNTGNERDKVMQQVQGIMKSVNHPVPSIREYICQLNLGGEILLSSAEGFSTEEKAREEFRKILVYAGLPENYERRDATGNYAHHLYLLGHDQTSIAAYPLDFVDGEKEDELISRITEYLAPHMYRIIAAEYPYKWKFRYGWINPEGSWEVLLESSDQFDSEEAAGNSYAGLISELPEIRVDTAEAKDGGMYVTFSNGHSRIIATSPATISATRISGYEQAAVVYLRSSTTYAKLVSPAPGQAGETILKTPGTRGGNYVYRVVKKDDCIAVHPCECGEKPLQSLLERLYATAEGGYNFLEICLGGDICEKIDGRFHFLIRDQKNDGIYFKSYTGYPTEEEARSAFDTFYLQIIDLASDPGNYGPYDPENIPPLLVSEEFNHEQGNCPNKKPLAVVSRHAAEKYSIEELAGIACTYPVRIRIIEEDEEACKTSSRICYFFHLVNPDAGRTDECKTDWKSKKCFESVKEARWAFRYFLHLLKYKGNYHNQLDEDRCCYNLVIREVLLESAEGFLTESAAWDALELLTKIACDPSAFFVRWDEAGCRFSIEIVTPEFQVDCNPGFYYSREKAQEALDTLAEKVRQYHPLQQDVSINQEEGGTYSFTISNEKEQVVWKGSKSYSTHEDAVSAAWLAIDLSREEGFYGEEDGQVMLFTKNRQFAEPAPKDQLAVHPADNNGPDKTALLARAARFPFSKDDEGFYYRIYDITEGTPADLPAVLLENSVRSRTLGETQELFARTNKLIQSKSNFEIIDRDDCGRYYLCLTDPSARIAFHPLHYGQRCDVEETIGRILDCLNMEGMHLVEHILLRPHSEEACECFLPPIPDPDCTLSIPLPGKPPCKGSGDRPEREDYLEYIPGADPYSFWATVVLPGWPKRSCRLETREAFQTLMRKEAPAHMALNILWLSPEQMCKFETAFRRWLRWKSCKNICGDADPLCVLIECLGQLVNYEPCITPDDRDECDCEIPGAINRTNLFINYAFNSEKDKNFGTDFLKVLGLEGGTSFPGFRNVISLPKTTLSAIFKRGSVPFDTGTGEVVGLGIPGTSGEDTSVIPEEEITRGIRKRIAGYKANIETIEDSRFRDTEYYERSDLFLISSGEHTVYAGLMDILHMGYKRARSEAGRNRFINLMSNVTGYYLDRNLLNEQQVIHGELRENLMSNVVKAGNKDLIRDLLKVWDAEDWKKWYGSKAAAEIGKMLKSEK
jgi:uncharacterized protein YegP (UPF0339 family)